MIYLACQSLYCVYQGLVPHNKSLFRSVCGQSRPPPSPFKVAVDESFWTE